MSRRQASGQAMTEFLIAASFVLVPLFIGIPLLAKYIDIKQATIVAARYEAWEYTAWYNPNAGNDKLTNFDAFTPNNTRIAVTLPMKTPAQTRSEARQRLFSNINEETTLPITALDAGSGWKPSTRNTLWTNYRGQLLYQGNAGTESLTSDDSTPVVPVLGTVLNTLTKLVGWVFKGMGTILSLGNSNAKFTAMNTNGYAKSLVATPIRTGRSFVDTATLYGSPTAFLPNSLTVSARAGVLTDGWNSGGLRHTFNQSQGAVPSVALKNLLNMPVLNVVWSAVSILAPELSTCNNSPLWNVNNGKGSLWFGHVDIDAVPPDRLDGGGTISCDDTGMCNFSYNIPRPEVNCVP